jgi:SAM-dependent methyltransferase/uncharacterized protein YbaR (Trm112 family)
MLADLLVCPGCRVIGEGRIELRTLSTAGDVLACACGRKHPVVDGVPIVMPHADSYVREEIAAVLERDLPVEVANLLVAGGPDDAPYPRLLEHVSIYMDAHWGDRASPFVERVRARASHRVQRAVELGCSAGRIVAELAAGADQVVGVDLQLATLRRARRMLAGEPVTYGRRVVGRHYEAVRVSAPAVANATLVCGNALDPPLVPGAYERVVAFNVLDSVRTPRQLLAVIDALCAPGGEILVSSPYAWQSGIVDEAERLGGADPAAEITRILRTGQDLRASYRIDDEAELAWTLRRDARTEVAYRVHYLRATKAR